MEILPTVKYKIFNALGSLPPQGLEELSQYLDFLKTKYAGQRENRIVALGGRWQDIPFDVSDEDIRALRRHVTDELLTRSDNHGVSD